MKILISPAKSLGQQSLSDSLAPTQGIFLKEAEALAKKLKKLSVKQIEKMMHVSNDIATLNYTRFQHWEVPTTDKSDILPSIAQFTGEVYKGLAAESMNEKQLRFAQENIRILSGMYGLLRPLDRMFPYRLEMGTSWSITPKTKNLYQFWGNKISNQLNSEMDSEEVIVNLASNEYFKVVDKKTLKATVITPHFKEFKNGTYKIVMMYAKNARGKMARYIIDNQIYNVNDLKFYQEEGYRFQESLSTDSDWVFTR